MLRFGTKPAPAPRHFPGRDRRGVLMLLFMLGMVTLLIKQLRQPETAQRLGLLFATSAPNEPKPAAANSSELAKEFADAPPASPAAPALAPAIAVAAIIAATVVWWNLRKAGRLRPIPLRFSRRGESLNDDTTRRRLVELAERDAHT